MVVSEAVRHNFVLVYGADTTCHGISCGMRYLSLVLLLSDGDEATPSTASKTSLNSSVVDGSQDCLFAPISTTTDPLTGRLLEVR